MSDGERPRPCTEPPSRLTLAISAVNEKAGGTPSGLDSELKHRGAYRSGLQGYRSNGASRRPLRSRAVEVEGGRWPAELQRLSCEDKAGSSPIASPLTQK